MKPPTRLLQDPNVASSLRADLQRSWSDAQHYDTLDKLALFRDTLAHGTSNTDAPRSTSHTDVVQSTWKPWSQLQLGAAPWLKLALLVTLAASSFSALRPRQVQPSVRAPAPPPMAAEVPAPPRELVAPPELAAPSAPEPAPQPRAAPPPPQRMSRREIEQLVGMRALLERDPEAALRLAQRSEQEFPNGALKEEREALTVLALAKRGTHSASDEARRKAVAFLLRHPHSTLRAQLERLIAQ